MNVKADFKWLYYKEVTLIINSDPKINNPEFLANINFEPKILKHGSNSVSTATIIADNEIQPGNYQILLIGTGDDGKTHKCSLFIKVIIKPSEVTINYDLKTIKIEEVIKGTAKNIPKGQKIWIIIYSHSTYKYYPINEVNIQNDKWSVPVVIGTKSNTGEKFDIIAVLADQKAQEKLNASINTGILELPNSIKECNKITVTREPSETTTEKVIKNYDQSNDIVKIISPKENEEVPYEVPIDGILIKKIPPNKELWPVKEIGKERYFPDEGPADIQDDKWYTTAYIGNYNPQADDGRPFIIHIVLISQETGAIFAKHIQNSYKQGMWHAIHTLYDGEIVATVKVTRNNSKSITLKNYDQSNSLVKIINPIKNKKEGHEVSMDGCLVKKIPINKELWVVKEVGKGRYHPDNGPITIEGDKWYTTAYVGNYHPRADDGRTFVIHIVLISQENGAKFAEYIKKSHSRDIWCGINTIYDGEIVATVKVIRTYAVER